MARVKVIPRNPAGTNYYLVDACFLANKFIPLKRVKDKNEQKHIQESLRYWSEIESQVSAKKAIIYIPDVCIAESFKVLAKKYYRSKYFANSVEYGTARNLLSEFIRTPSKELKKARRTIAVHDVSTSRDIIIAVDRFFEAVQKKNLNHSCPK